MRAHNTIFPIPPPRRPCNRHLLEHLRRPTAIILYINNNMGIRGIYLLTPTAVPAASTAHIYI